MLVATAVVLGIGAGFTQTLVPLGFPTADLRLAAAERLPAHGV